MGYDLIAKAAAYIYGVKEDQVTPEMRGSTAVRLFVSLYYGPTPIEEQLTK